MAIDNARAESLFAQIRDGRVGGPYWDPLADPWMLERVSADGDDERIAIAAIRGIPVVVTKPGRFGTPASGADRQAIACHLLADTAYCDPFTGVAIEAEKAVTMLSEWRRLLDGNREIAAALGMAWWKHREIAAFLWDGGAGHPRFLRSEAKACGLAKAHGGALAVWPSRISPTLRDRARRQGTPIIRVEDGFIRSVGLGSGLHPPYSIAVDRLGIHYDPSRPSQLEHLLQTAEFSPELVARATALRQTLVERGIGKYGGKSGAILPPRTPNRRLVLVTGQVSDDLSVLTGGGGIVANADLLARSRAMEPNAEIWFRPHPDVDAGHRHGAIPDADALRYADRVVRDGSMAELLDIVDGLHVLTSLSGFEALLRGRDVTTHGTPFYAGWGLSRDLAPTVARRTRRLKLDELVAGTLILFPRYLDPVTGLPCSVEILVERFTEGFTPRLRWLLGIRSIQGRLRLGRH